MEIPNPIKVQVDVNFNFNRDSTKEHLSDEVINPVDFNKVTLDSFRTTFHKVIIYELKDIYNNEDWKKILLKRAKDVHKYNIDKQLLTKFENGDSVTENLFLIILKELYFQKKQFSVTFSKDGTLAID